MNKVIQWDCLEVMKSIEDNSVDLVLTDPPYWIDIDKKLRKCAWNKWPTAKANRKDYWETERDSWRPNKEFFDQIQRISKNAIIFWWNYFSSDLPDSSCRIVRNKNTNWHFADCELARTNFKTAVRKFDWTWNWMLQEDMKNKETREHPTQKPLPLFRRILENYSEKWMTVLDCFAWSGTTGVACKEMWRNYILIEKEPKYIDIINKRLENTTIGLF